MQKNMTYHFYDFETVADSSYDCGTWLKQLEPCWFVARLEREQSHMKL